MEKLSTRKLQAHVVSVINYTKHLRKKLFQFYTNLRKYKRMEHFPTHFETNIILISKANKNLANNGYKLTSLMNIDTKVLNNLLAN